MRPYIDATIIALVVLAIGLGLGLINRMKRRVPLPSISTETALTEVTPAIEGKPDLLSVGTEFSVHS